MRNTQRLRRLVEARQALTVPGAANGMFARVVEDLGFEAVYVTGAGLANMHLGAPDIGLTTLTELAGAVAGISDAVSIPIIVDADTGFGNALNTYRTVRVLERAGASAVQIEDQVFPKRCGHFSGKEVVPAGEMVQKIKAAVDSRMDGDLMIIARTDALAVEGIQCAIDRASMYIDAGADMTFVEAPASVDEMRLIRSKLQAPQVANIVFGGKTPDPGRAELATMGYSIVLYANAVLQAALRASYVVLQALKEDGELGAVVQNLATFDERQNAVAKPFWDALDSRYRLEMTTPELKARAVVKTMP